jgi:two-component system, NtrC family, response regulator AlgB
MMMSAAGTAQAELGTEFFERSFSALVADHDPAGRQALRVWLEAEHAHVSGVSNVAAALDALDRAMFDVIFLDASLMDGSGIDSFPEILRRAPSSGVIVITESATFESAVEAMRRGATDYLPKPFTPDQIRIATRRFLESSSLKHRTADREQRVDDGASEATFSSRSPSFKESLQSAARAAATDCVILLRGESGTGKNMLARWVRAQSSRATAPFVTVNCPELSRNLMSSVLFGHRRGAFTGAIGDVAGKVQEAEGGTLFLDEVGDLNAEAQARLLRFLNDRSYERLGETTERQANVRLIASTNRDLEEDVRTGRFRDDLLHRLNVVALTLPPLRDRTEDILPLARHYLGEFARRQRRRDLRLSPGAERAITDYGWPGNVRELRNAVERAVILAASSVIEPADLGLLENTAEPASVGLGSLVTLDQLEREHIARVVVRSPTLEAAARTLGIDTTTLQRKRKRFGLV